MAYDDSDDFELSDEQLEALFAYVENEVQDAAVTRAEAKRSIWSFLEDIVDRLDTTRQAVFRRATLSDLINRILDELFPFFGQDEDDDEEEEDDENDEDEDSEDDDEDEDEDNDWT